MSVRTLQQECAEHVTIRGTSVSLSFAAPSVMHVTVVHKFGLPNKHGIIPCDDYVLHLRFDHKNASEGVFFGFAGTSLFGH